MGHSRGPRWQAKEEVRKVFQGAKQMENKPGICQTGFEEAVRSKTLGNSGFK